MTNRLTYKRYKRWTCRDV